jgi:hypothetical protein
MEVVGLAESGWMTTVPRRVAPGPDEWFPGVVLRCDALNHWNSGTTLRLLLEATGQLPWGPKAPVEAVVPAALLEGLAEVLQLPQEQVLATTYHMELARLYGLPNPHPRLLSRRSSFQICPVCVAHRRFLQRTLLFPHLSSCLVHQVELVNMCRCGRQLSPFAQETPPFTCRACGLAWAHLETRPVPPGRLAQEQQRGILYAYFLRQGTPEVLASTAEMLRRHARAESWNHSRTWTEFWVPYGRRLALEFLVERMVKAGLTAKDILTYW